MGNKNAVMFDKKCKGCGKLFGSINIKDEYCIYCDPKNQPVSQAPSNAFNKADNGKLQWTLLPFEQLEEVVKVMTGGKVKYGRDNWKKVTEEDRHRLEDALLRHTISYVNGEKYDDMNKGGDGLNHMAHAICEALFILYLDSQEKKDA